MSPEENLSSDLEPNSDSSSTENMTDAALVSAEGLDLEPVQANLVHDESNISEIVEAEVSGSSSIVYPYGSQPASSDAGGNLLSSTPAMAGNFENLAAKGGAVGALVLGTWCFAGSFITNWSIINGLIGLLMGFGGLSSTHKKTAWIGIALCLAGMLLSLVQVSELVNAYLNARDESF